MKKTNSDLKLYLLALFITCLLVSNIVAGKQMQLPFGITMTGALVVFPITYILSDVFSEVYGYRWSRISCYMAFAANMLMVLVFQIVILAPAAQGWQGQNAFQTVLGSTPRIFAASTIGFLLGDYANDKVFQFMKRKHENDSKGFCSRAILSSVAGELVDSAFFIPLAFLGQMPFSSMVVMGITQAALKVVYEIIILPVTSICCKKVKIYESR